MAKSKSKSLRRAASKSKGTANKAATGDVLERIAAALERLAPRHAAAAEFNAADAFIWHPDGRLVPVAHVNRVEMSLLKGIDRVRDVLVENTERFAKGLPANNALLWGARGMGKSSLVKATHAGANAALGHGNKSSPLKLIEIHREDIDSLPDLMGLTRGAQYRFIVFCDDLSFDAEDTTYKSLKAVLEGGIEGRPDNVIFYATSNRRHLMSRDMMENERSTAINPGETVEEKVSLSDLLAYGSASIAAARTNISRWSTAMSLTTRSPLVARPCTVMRWNGRRRAARAQVALRGNSCRILPDASASR